MEDLRNARPADARSGGDVDVRPFPLPLQVRKHLLASQEHALQVHVVDPVPTLLAGLYRTADFNDADIVVQYVDPPKRRDASVDYRSDIIGTGHVPGDDLADAALTLDDPFVLDGGIEVEVAANNL